MSAVVRGIDHIGITVRDIEEASAFLVEALDAQVMYDLFAPSRDPQRPGTELNGPDGPTGEVVSSRRPRGERPILRAGDNELRFECGLDTPVNPRARVTVLSRSPDSFGR